MRTRTWHVQLYLYEDEHHTRADAVLTTDTGAEVRHAGEARLHPHDRPVPEIGDELAAARALSGLAHDLLEAAIVDVRANDPDRRQPRIAAD